MRDIDKILFGIAGAAGVYLLFTASSREPVAPVGPSPRTTTEDRVMAYSALIWENALSRMVEPAVIAAVIATESSGMPRAEGAAGELGLMQIMPSTAESYCNIQRHELLTPSKNIACGTMYLRGMMDRFGHRWIPPVYVATGLSAYNCGPGNVHWDLYTGNLTAPESTKRYVKKVIERVPRFRQLFQELPQFNSYTSLFPPADWNLKMFFD